jgi:hypothetical protein
MLNQEEIMEDRSSRPSRRRFLSSSIGAAAALLKSSAKPALAHPPDAERERLARVLAEYGSELGNLRKVQGRE